MSHIDVFNGDADGLCALHQLRLASPCDAKLITGVKRNNALLGRLHGKAGDSVTVLDLSLANNKDALLALLEKGVSVEYFDHHCAPDLPAHPHLHLVVDTTPGVCTSVLVDRHLGGAHRKWAVVGAFGDNMPETARPLGRAESLTGAELQQLKQLGECLNYNSYGDSEDDLLYPPAKLYRLMQPYTDPLRFIQDEDVYDKLERQRIADMNEARAMVPSWFNDTASVFQLPDAAWARRVVGCFANRLQSTNAEHAYAILVPNVRDTFTASLRTPASAGIDAEAFARRYEGGGRRTAAGINDLPPLEAERFADDFIRTFGGTWTG